MKDFNALAEARLERLEEDVHFLKVIVLMLSVCGLLLSLIHISEPTRPY